MLITILSCFIVRALFIQPYSYITEYTGVNRQVRYDESPSS